MLEQIGGKIDGIAAEWPDHPTVSRVGYFKKLPIFSLFQDFAKKSLFELASFHFSSFSDAENFETTGTDWRRQPLDEIPNWFRNGSGNVTGKFS